MDVTVRLQPGLDFGHVELIQTRIAELKASIAEGGPREAAIRALLYISQAGAGADERTFNTLRQIRSENDDLTLQAFKRTCGNSISSSVSTPRGPSRPFPQCCRPTCPCARACWTDVSGECAERLQEVEKLFSAGLPAAPQRASLKAPARAAVARRPKELGVF